MDKMNYTLISFGLMIIIFGLIFTYVMISSLITMTANFEQMEKQLASDTLKAQRNEIFTNSLPGLVVVAIGILLIRIGLKKQKF
jgi:ABC-type nickel/cobalt efflux system permease component RcnA